MKWLTFFLLAPWVLWAETAQQPEFSSGYHPKLAVYAKKMLVASANAYASHAGMSILEKGGNAMDAAIAMQLVLGVVEPQSSGIGGGAFLLYYHKEKKQVLAYDGRETAPTEVDEEMFLDANKEPIQFQQAAIGGKSVAVPGLLKMLEMAHQEQGKLPWKELFTPAIDLAQQGFPISSRLHQLIHKTKKSRYICFDKRLFFLQMERQKKKEHY